MGFFSGLMGIAAPIIGGMVGGPAGAAIGAGLTGLSGTMAGEETNRENRASADNQMQFQADQNQKAMDFTHAQGEINRNWQTETNQAANLFSASQANNAMAFSERMAGSQYQRAVSDMRAAGINPMLAVSNGGAAAPSGVSSSGASGGAAPGSGGVTSAGSSYVARNPIEGASTALSMARNAAETENVLATKKNIDAQTANIRADTGMKLSQAGAASSSSRLSDQQANAIFEKLRPEIDSIKASTDHSRASAEQVRSQNLLMKDLMANPVTRPFAPLLNLIFK